jgi:Uma2 family endonuclease
MSVQTQHRFSVEDYYRMAETGVLRPNARVELLAGRIIDMSPIGPFHGSITKYLIQLFTTAARKRWISAVQDPVRLDDYSEPQPDLRG